MVMVHPMSGCGRILLHSDGLKLALRRRSIKPHCLYERKKLNLHLIGGVQHSIVKVDWAAGFGIQDFSVILASLPASDATNSAR